MTIHDTRDTRQFTEDRTATSRVGSEVPTYGRDGKLDGLQARNRLLDETNQLRGDASVALVRGIARGFLRTVRAWVTTRAHALPRL